MDLKPAHEHQDASGAEQPVFETKSIDEIVERIENNLAKIDLNNDGEISKQEAVEEIKRYEQAGIVSPEEANQVIKGMEGSQGSVSINGVVHALSAAVIYGDKNMDGHIDKGEFQADHGLKFIDKLNNSIEQAYGK